MFFENMKFIGLVFIFSLIYCDADEISSYRYKKQHHRLWCLNDQFTCSPTQCVDNSVLCDGVHDCEDGSDESPELCKSINPRSCILPKQTYDKSYKVNCNEHDLGKPGEYVPELSLLSYACNPGFTRNDAPDTHFQSFCLNGTWIPAIPTCNKLCKKPHNPHLKAVCYHGNKEVECQDEHKFGAKLHLSCTLPYHYPSHEEIVCTENGEWDVKDVKCIAECGKYTDEAEHLLKGNDLPWHVIIKRKNHDGGIYVFSGTLITPNLILTVARTVADHNDHKLPPEDFEVIVNNLLDHEYQKHYKVKDIFFSNSGFASKENIAEESDDIAVLYLAKNVDIDATVMPVCVDWTGVKLLPGALQSVGKLVRTGEDHDSEKPTHQDMCTVVIEAFDYKTCVNKIPNGALQYDQFCGNVTEHKATGASDWGSGYYVENPKDLKYFIKGILRLSYGDDGIKVFSDVPSHIEWIANIRRKIDDIEFIENSHYELELEHDYNSDCAHYDNCPLKLNHTDHRPVHYGALELSCEHGDLHMKFQQGCHLPFKNYSNFEFDVKCPSSPHNDLEAYCKRSIEGASVPEYSTLSTHCKCGHAQLSKKMEKSVCFNGQWLPEPVPCKKTCRKLFPEGVHLKCSYEGKLIDCEDTLVAGTLVHYECYPGYAPEFPIKSKELLCDEEGEWNGPLLRCNPVCGKALVKTPSTSAVDAKSTDYKESFPWHVAIYDKTKNYDLVCSGSILTDNTIITAAHCFYDSNDKKRNISDFVVAVAKLSRDFKIKDTPKTQFYDLETLSMKNYYGEVWKYFNNLVIVKTKTKIAFNPEVFPVCMQLDKLLPAGHLLQTSGWGGHEGGKKISHLKISELPYITLNDCIHKAPLSAKPYILEDKSCLGRHNESIENFADSGSGVFYFDKVSSTYHIFGIANMMLHDYPYITIFTNTNYHANWIRSTHSSLSRSTSTQH
ncbi:uncharacterized protein LOC135837231 [Planococcus citri]|uniref:uncharacterized protein LOC135837231 n=1 Tax=Planococcus citri TaxID=170843 RepID=UPI0031FA12E9